MISRILRRFFHVSCYSRSVRVRFAPSPTGYIHLGGIRTALYNFLFARAHGGKFVLRLEDTDQKRLVPGAAKQLEDDLVWMGLTPDESPLKGGSYGPYTQSERLAIYQSFVQELVKNGHAYPCFCTDRRLEILKKEAVREGAIPRYDNRCRHLSQSQVEDKKRKGMPHCLRFTLSPLDEPLSDIVCGDVDRSAALHEGDPVILKQDGYPTYHFANVIDDHLMEITHVLRGAEWLVSTPKHVLLYKAFGWTPPAFAHLPLIMNSDGTKLSKRQDDIRLEYFRSKGYYPEAIIGLLCLVGGGFPSADMQQKLFTLDQLPQLFDLKSVTTHPSRLDMLRLEHFNSLALQHRIRDEKSCSEIVSQLSQLVRRTIPEESRDEEILEETNLSLVLRWAVEEGRIHRLDELVLPDMAFLWSRPQVSFVTKIDLKVASRIVTSVMDWLQDRDTADKKEVSDYIRKLAADNAASCKVSDVMKLMRSALSGLKEGPSVGEIIQILGPKVCHRRLESSLKLMMKER